MRNNKSKREIYFESEAEEARIAEKTVLVLLFFAVLLECAATMLVMYEDMKRGAGREDGLTLGLWTIGFTVGLYLLAKIAMFCNSKKGR